MACARGIPILCAIGIISDIASWVKGNNRVVVAKGFIKMGLHKKVEGQGFVKGRRVAPISWECMLILIIKLVFVREFSKTPCKITLQTEVEVALEEFNGTEFSQDRTLSFLQDVINGTVPSVDPFQDKLESQ